VKRRDDWAIGYQDETWWSRFAHPNLHSWAEGEPVHLVQPGREEEDGEPKALACYGLDLRWQEEEEVWLRFVEGNPKSGPTKAFLEWVVVEAAKRGIRVLVMVWDWASWHRSQQVRRWIHEHNQRVKRTGEGTRLLVVFLPKRSPWLNPIEAKWLHAKRKVSEPERKLSVQETMERVYAVFGQPVLPWLKDEVA